MNPKTNICVKLKNSSLHCNIQYFIHLWYEDGINKEIEYFCFQWTKNLYQNNFNHIAFFFTLFKALNVVSYRYMKSFQRQFLREPKKTNFKSFKFHNMKSYARRFYLCLLNSCEIWNFISLGSHKNLSFGVISYNLYSSLKTHPHKHYLHSNI